MTDRPPQRWSNWAGNERCRPAHLHHARSVGDIQGLVSWAAERGLGIRVAGTGHSHYRLVPTDDVIIDLSALTGVSAVTGTDGTEGRDQGSQGDDGQPRAWLWAGTTIAAAGPALAAHGVGLINQGDIDRQTIAGAVATGTHGTGEDLTNFSAAVSGIEVVGADGRVRTFGPGDPELAVAKLNLGAIGVVTRVELAVRPAYRLADQASQEPWDELRPTIPERIGTHRHFEFFWYPPADGAQVKWIDETTDEPVYPIGPEGERQGWSHEVLPSHRPHLHTEMEYSVPLDRSLECLDEIRALILADFPDLVWPVEYRTLAADDVWMSTAYQRPTATISVHQGIDTPDRPLFEACERVFRQYDGRPHWGKVHYLDGAELAAVHPRWDDWWALRDQLDPDGMFLNDRLAGLRP